MTVIAIVEALVLLAVVHLLMRHHSNAEKAWTEERRELVSRIQRPEIIPGPVTEFVVPDMPEDELDMVGVIQDPPSEAQ